MPLKMADNREIEERFSHFDHAAMLKKLQDLGASHFGTFLFKVMTFHCSKGVQMLRVRDEGHRKTVTLKESSGGRYPNEYETNIEDFDMMIKIFLAAGHKKLYYVEKIREIYQLDNVEIVFDHLPGLPPLMEIEAPDEKQLEAMIQKLELVREPSFGGNDLYERHYGISKRRPYADRLDFTTAAAHFTPYICKNKEMMQKVLEQQKDMLDNLSIGNSLHSLKL